MTAGNFLYLLSEPFACDTPLKLDREKAVISSRQNMNGDVGPVLEAARFAENSVGFLARLLRAGAQHVMRHVVQEVRRHIEFRRIAAAHGANTRPYRPPQEQGRMMPSEFSSVAARLVTQRRRDEPLATGNPLPQSCAHATRTGPHWHVSFPNRWTDSLVDTISSIFT